MAAPGIDFDRSRFPIAVKSDLPDGRPDIADVLYGAHRCVHGHDDELPEGFELTPHGPRPQGVHIWRTGKIQLPASVVIGLLAVAVFSPENKGEVIPDGYQLSWYQHVFHIWMWWGWQEHFRADHQHRPDPAGGSRFLRVLGRLDAGLTMAWLPGIRTQAA